MSELLPCPFCGGKVHVEDDGLIIVGGGKWIKHDTERCMVGLNDFGLDEPIEAVWNKRSAPPLGGESSNTTTQDEVLTQTVWIKVYADDVIAPNGDTIHDGIVLEVRK